MADKYQFEEDKLVQLRRFCGYPMYGAERNSASPWFGTHFFERWGVFEYRISNLTQAEGSAVDAHIEQLVDLEAAILAATKTLIVDQAAVFKRNPAEMKERVAIYENWRHRLCALIGVSAGPHLGASGGTRNVSVTI